MWPSSSSSPKPNVSGDLSSSLSIDKGKSSLYDSGRTDSGFLSGGNIVTESLTSGEITPPPEHEEDVPSAGERQGSTGVSAPAATTKPTSSSKEGDNAASYMRLDSGVDLGLSEQLNELSIEEEQSVTPQIVLPMKHSTEESSWQLYFQQDDEGDTQLHIAIIQGFVEVVFSLIRMVPSAEYLNIRNDMRQTGLHLAVLTNQPRVLRRLICAGADLSVVDRSGNTALHLACWAGNSQCVRALTEPVSPSELAAADLSYTPTLSPVRPNTYNYEGLTCVHISALSGHIELLKYLVKCGADIDARECKSGRTLLHMAAEIGDETLALLLLKDFIADPYIPNYAGHTPYHYARRIPSFIRTLVAHGAPHEPEFSSDEDDEDDSSDIQMYDAGFRDLYTGIVNAPA